MSREDVIRRLKSAKQAEATEEREEGQAAGRSWAEEMASPKQLRRLQAMASEPGSIDAQLAKMSKGGALQVGRELYLYLHAGKRDPIDTTMIRTFWEEILGTEHLRIEDVDFASGFVEGALEVWEEVKEEI